MFPLKHVRIARRAWLLPALTAVLWAQPSQSGRLPADVTPSGYDLSLSPDAVELTFHARVRIAIDVITPTPRVILNADGLTFDHVDLDNENPVSIGEDTKLQRADFTFAHAIPAGRHILSIDYQGVIGNSTLGFFAMDYNSPAGRRRTLATNFEPASEREFMPSWDEPGRKATFTLTVDVPTDRTAVSNMPVASTEPLPNGLKRVHFATSPKMSTYLFFFAEGDFERIATTVDGIDVGVIVDRGDTEKGRYALAEAAKLLHYYNGYFGFPYPLPKLDLIAAPGDIDGSSMENWGAIFYSQGDLLFDPKNSTDAVRQRVFMVVAHEMSHQWFGDLVTMDWWDNIWLNEGFARWMQTKAANVLHPEWKTALQALAIAESGKRADSKPSTHPILQPVLSADQAEQAFDSITYDKGASVIGMLEAWVGPDVFRDGVRRYMRAHAYGNTVDTDFWSEVQAASGKPVLEVERNFTTQPGLPLLYVESEQTADGETKVVLRQGRYAQDPSTISGLPAQQWRIPITLGTLGKSSHAPVSLLYSGTGADGPASTLEVRGKAPVIVNAGQTSYVRVLYPAKDFGLLAASLSTASPADQMGLLYDAWALGIAGDAPISNYLVLARALPAAADPAIWSQVVPALVQIDRYFDGDPGQPAFRSFARNLLAPIAARLGWAAVRGEDDNAATLRNAVLIALSRFGDQTVIEQARSRFEGEVPLSPETRETALAIVARNADAKTLDRLIAALRATRDPLDKERQYEALLHVADPAGASRMLELALGPDVPAGTVDSAMSTIATEHPDLVWEFALRHVDQPGFPVASSSRLSLMPGIAARSDNPKRAAELLAYAELHIPPAARQNVDAAISTIGQNAKFRAERIPEISSWLARAN